MAAVNPVRLNHAVLFVADLERAERFYTEVFGMVVAAREPRAHAAFLRLPRSGNHHDLGLFGVGKDTPAKRPGGIGLYHLAWQVDTIDELEQARLTLANAGALGGESSHGATKSIYGADPTVTSSRSCGCCLARTGVPMRTPPRSSPSTWPAKLDGGPVGAPPGRSCKGTSPHERLPCSLSGDRRVD